MDAKEIAEELQETIVGEEDVPRGTMPHSYLPQ